MYNPSLLIELRELCGVSLEEAGFKANVTAEAIARAEMGGGLFPTTFCCITQMFLV